MFTDIKYTWCQIFSKKRQILTGRHALQSQAIEQLEAQMTLGHFYIVPHDNLTYDIITEIKQAINRWILLPQLFSFMIEAFKNTNHPLHKNLQHPNNSQFSFLLLLLCFFFFFTNFDTDISPFSKLSSFNCAKGSSAASDVLAASTNTAINLPHFDPSRIGSVG